jgi:hypothetical protein
VEHIWREIISTFTAMQAPFTIAAGPAEDALAMRDVIRFYFGFSVPISEVATNEEAVAHVARSGSEIAVVAAEASGRWWEGLIGAGAPKVFAKLPFVEVPERPAALPAYVIGPPLRDWTFPDTRLVAIEDSPRARCSLGAFGGLVAHCAGDVLLAELPAAVRMEDLGSQCAGNGPIELGGFFRPIRRHDQHGLKARPAPAP